MLSGYSGQDQIKVTEGYPKLLGLSCSPDTDGYLSCWVMYLVRSLCFRRSLFPPTVSVYTALLSASGVAGSASVYSHNSMNTCLKENVCLGIVCVDEVTVLAIVLQRCPSSVYEASIFKVCFHPATLGAEEANAACPHGLYCHPEW